MKFFSITINNSLKKYNLKKNKVNYSILKQIFVGLRLKCLIFYICKYTNSSTICFKNSKHSLKFHY